MESACHPHTPKKHLPPLAEPVQWHHDSKGNPGMDVAAGHHIVSAAKIRVSQRVWQKTTVFHSIISQISRNTLRSITEMVWGFARTISGIN
jgi:hypothetical protein